MEANEYPPYRVPSIEDVRGEDYFLPYARTLRKVFAEVLGWTQYETNAYIEKRLQESSFRSFFGHYTPCQDAASAIVPARLRDKLSAHGISTVDIHKAITEVLEGSNETYNIHPDTDPDYDWQRARDEIADIILEYERTCKG